MLKRTKRTKNWFAHTNDVHITMLCKKKNFTALSNSLFNMSKLRIYFKHLLSRCLSHSRQAYHMKKIGFDWISPSALFIRDLGKRLSQTVSNSVNHSVRHWVSPPLQTRQQESHLLSQPFSQAFSQSTTKLVTYTTNKAPTESWSASTNFVTDCSYWATPPLGQSHR